MSALADEGGAVLCVLFDLNGTLVHRTDRKGRRERGAAYAPVGKDAGKRCVYVRPGGAEVLAELALDPRVVVGVYTSTMRKNAVKMTAVVAAAACTDVPDAVGQVPEWAAAVRERVADVGGVRVSARVLPQLDVTRTVDEMSERTVPDDAGCDEWDDGVVEFVLDRGFNKVDPDGAKQSDTLRDFDKAWAVLSHYGFGPSNVVIVDNEARKVREHPDNAIVVASFEAPSVAGPAAVEGFAAMTALRDYVLDLADGMAAGADVRELISAAPFDTDERDWVARPDASPPPPTPPAAAADPDPAT